MAEYYAEGHCEKPGHIHYVQLKHSTKNPNEPFTRSDLKRTLKAFADRFSALKDARGLRFLQRKVRFVLASNRALQPDLERTIKGRSKDDVLERYIRLSDQDYEAFLGCVRLATGGASYLEEGDKLGLDLRKHLPAPSLDSSQKLANLVARKATSEFEENRDITQYDLLQTLQVFEEDLLPASSKLRPTPNFQSREQYAEIVRRILASEGTPIIVHAAGGLGKSVFAKNLHAWLPHGSVCITYDCFANGEYRAISGSRHRHRTALTQIANELALEGLCDLLVPTSGCSSQDYMRSLIHRLGQATSLVSQRSPMAVLVIAIDAADNAELCAADRHEGHSFARDLLRENLVPKCHLVCTTRSHRIPLLDPPSTVESIELDPFTVAETHENLRAWFPEATQLDSAKFHRATAGNPRLQAMYFDGAETLASVLTEIGPEPSDPDTAIHERLEATVGSIADHSTDIERTQISRICETLGLLRPPIPLPVIATVAGVPQSQVKSFVSDIGRPLLLLGDAVQFRDEPIETWFREECRPSQSELKRVIDNLRPLQEKSVYIAKSLPDLLVEAGLLEDATLLAMETESLKNLGRIERRAVMLARSRTALRATITREKYDSATRIALKAAAEESADVQWADAFRNNTDICCKLLDESTLLEALSSNPFYDTWTGSHLVYEAAALSNFSSTMGEAEIKLDSAKGWLTHFFKEPSHDSNLIQPYDIAELAIALLNLKGPQRTASFLETIRPNVAAHETAGLFGRRLSDAGRFDDLGSVIENVQRKVAVYVGLAQEAPRLGRQRVYGPVLKTIMRFAQMGWPQLEGRALEAALFTFESALSTFPNEADQVNTEPFSTLSIGLNDLHGDDSTLRSILAARSLHAAKTAENINSLDIIDEYLEADLRKPSSRHRSKVVALVQSVFPWFQLRAQAILLERLPTNFLNHLEDSLGAWQRQARTTPYWLASAESIANCWFDIGILSGNDREPVLSQLKNWVKTEAPALIPSLFPDFVHRLARTNNCNTLASDFAIEARTHFERTVQSADHGVDFNMRMARATWILHPDEARGYLERVMDALYLPGDHQQEQWQSLLAIAASAAPAVNSDEDLAFRLSIAAETTCRQYLHDDAFDWSATIETLLKLSVPTCWATVSRWRDMQLGRFKDLLQLLVEHSMEADILDPKLALLLTPMDGDWEIHRIIDRVLQQCVDADQKAEVWHEQAPYFRLDSPLPTLRKVLATLNRHQLDAQVIVQEVQYRLTGREHQSSSELAENQRKAPSPSPHDKPSIAEIVETYQLLDARSTNEGLTFFAKACDGLDASNWATLVEALPLIGYESDWTMNAVLRSIPDDWYNQLAVQENMRRSLCTIARIAGPGISFDESVLQKCQLSTLSVSRCIAKATANNEYTLTAFGLFKSIHHLSDLLTPAEAKSCLDEALESYCEQILISPSDWNSQESNQSKWNVEMSIAAYLWARLGSPDREERWRAAHAVCHSIALCQDLVIENLFGFACGWSDLGPFTCPEYVFYRDHAVMWFFLAIRRACTFHPKKMTRFIDHIHEVVQPEYMKHVIVRRLAQESIAELHVHMDDFHISDSPLAGPLDYKLMQQDVFVPNQEDQSSDQSYQSPTAFSVDLRPYWVEPLATVFQLPVDYVESRIVDRMTHLAGPVHLWNEDSREGDGHYLPRHIYHSHGEYPRVDTKLFYLFCHSLFSVAGELIEEYPVRKYQDSRLDEFEDWLSRHFVSNSAGHWISDIRDHVPSQSRPSKSDHEVSGPAWVRALSKARADDVCASPSGEFLLWGHWSHRTDQGGIERVSIQSALVKSNSMALLSALGACEEQHLFGLPSSEDSALEIDHGPYRLRGWCTVDHSDRGIDAADPWAMRPGARIYPADWLQAELSIGSDRFGKCWTNQTGKAVFHCTQWSQGRMDEWNDVESGSFLRIDRDDMLEALARLRSDLIVSVKIARSDNRPNPTEKSIMKVYLYRPHGQQESI